MSVKNVQVNDIAILELFRTGRTSAPRPVLDYHRRRGRVIFRNGIPLLTVAGVERAAALKGCEGNLRARAEAVAAGRSPLCAVPPGGTASTGGHAGRVCT
jgi:hypothetical protein